MELDALESPWNQLPTVRSNRDPARSVLDTGLIGPLIVFMALAFVAVSTLIELYHGWMHDAWFGLLLAKMFICVALWKGRIWARWLLAILLWLSALLNLGQDNRWALALFYGFWILGALLIASRDVYRFLQAQRKGRPYVPALLARQFKRAVGCVLILGAIAAAYCTPIVRLPLLDSRFSSEEWKRGDVRIRGGMARYLASSDYLHHKSREEVRDLLGTPDDGCTIRYKVDLGYRWIIDPYLYDLVIRFDKTGRVFQVSLTSAGDE